jgi:hypothetical protein
MIWQHGNGHSDWNWLQQDIKHFPTIWPQKISIKPRSLKENSENLFTAKDKLGGSVGSPVQREKTEIE